MGVGIPPVVLQGLGHIPSRYYHIRDHDVGSGECIVEPILGMARVYASLVIADNRSRELKPLTPRERLHQRGGPCRGCRFHVDLSRFDRLSHRVHYAMQ